MTHEDQLLIDQRRKEDKRKFILQAMNPENAPRLAPALQALRVLLLDGQWHAWSQCVATMLRAGDLAVKTVDTQMRNALYTGLILRRGEYAPGSSWGKHKKLPVDDREVKIRDWPEV